MPYRVPMRLLIAITALVFTACLAAPPGNRFAVLQSNSFG